MTFPGLCYSIKLQTIHADHGESAHRRFAFAGKPGGDTLLPAPLIVLITIALVYAFLNGFHDASTVSATMISSRAIRPSRALILTALGELIGPFLFGLAVARTIATGIISPDEASLALIIAALLAAIAWDLFTWWLAIPSSSSHALVGGLVGAALMKAGTGAVLWGGVLKVLLSLLVSPLLGFLGGMLMMRVVLFLVRRASPRINLFFKGAQLVTTTPLALTHGSIDSQKTMGMIVLGMAAYSGSSDYSVPLWVVAASAAAISAGALAGGFRLIKTLGIKLMKVRPVHAFTSQLVSSIVNVFAAMVGGPISTTHVVSSSIVGVGSAERLTRVRWNVARDFVFAWLFTLPAAGILSALLFWLFSHLPGLGGL